MVHSYGPDSEEPRTETMDALVETECEWIMLDRSDWKIRYPKHGYEPIPLSDSKTEVSQGKAQQAFTAYYQERYPQEIQQIVPRNLEEVNGVDCYVSEVQDEKGNSESSFAVAKDLRRFYKMEQVKD